MTYGCMAGWMDGYRWFDRELAHLLILLQLGDAHAQGLAVLVHGGLQSPQLRLEFSAALLHHRRAVKVAGAAVNLTTIGQISTYRAH